MLTTPGSFGGTERFQLVRHLGEGGFGIVYQARDLVDGGSVALKLLRRPYAERLYRFKREFRALAELRHGNLVRLHELVASGTHVFFTMELVEGAPLLTHLGARPDALRETLRQLAEGVAALHRAGKIHRDIKPSNVLVEKGGRVVLLDFGLAVEIDAGDTSEMAGTPLYMSPEQCAGETLSEASDWYSVGVVLFQALTGALPFVGSAPRVIEEKQEREAPRPSMLALETPPDLDELCAALLARDPSQRPNGDEVLRRLAAQASPQVARRDPFVGRAAELAMLSRCFDDAVAGKCTVALARGQSGIGKSALLRHFLDEVRRLRPDAVILAGRCYELESVPYKALDAVVDELARQLRRWPEVEAAALLPRDVHALTTLFPVLRQVPAFARGAAGQIDRTDAGDARGRALQALRELFARLADRRPVVVCVDDLQWGDIDSAVLLTELTRAPNPPSVLWVASFREEEAATSPMLQRLTQLRETTLKGLPIHELHLAGLDGREALELAATLVGDDPRRAQSIAHESGGSPFFVHELARTSGEDHALSDLVRRRVAQLEGAAQRVLQVVAVAVRPIEIEVAADAAGAGDDLRDALDTLRTERLVRTRESEGRKLVESYHDRIRESVTAALAPSLLAELHLRLAAALERRDTVDAAEVGHHLSQGGSPARAHGFLVRAAERAAAALAFEEAAQLYHRALELRPQIPDAGDSLALELAYAETLSFVGRGAEAGQRWLALVPRVAEEERPNLQRRAAEELLMSGHLDEGFAAMSGVLARLGISMPRSHAAAIVRIVLNRIRGVFSPPRFRERPKPVSHEELLRVDTLCSIAWSVEHLDPFIGYALVSEHLRIAVRTGDRQRAAIAFLLEAVVSAVRGGQGDPRAQQMLASAHEMRVGLPEITLPKGSISAAEGLIALFEGRWPEGLAHLEAAERALNTSTSGHTSLRGTIYTMATICLFWMGRSGSVLQVIPSRIREMEEQSNVTTWLWLRLLEAWAQSCNGNFDEAWAVSEYTRTKIPDGEFQLQRWYLEHGQVKFLLLQGKAEQAWKHLVEVGNKVRLGATTQVQRVGGWWVRANTALARALENPSVKSEMLAFARKQAKALEGQRATWVRGVAKGIRASIASVEGDDEAALRLLAEAEPLLESHHLEASLASCQLIRGRLIGGDTGRDLVARAEAWLVREGAAPTLPRVLLPGRWN
jgi:hypothetical protein